MEKRSKRRRRGRGKTLSSILVLLMLLTCIPADVFASDQESGTEIDGVVKNHKSFYGEGFETEFRVTSQWNGAFNGEIILKNTGDVPLENWALGFRFDHRITSSWNANIIEYEDGICILKNKGWNGIIPVGGKVNLGFSAEWTEAVTAPKDYRICSREQEADPQDYTVEFKTTNDWGTGFNGEISITNNDDKPLEYWTLSFDFDKNIQKFWDARIIGREENHYIVKHADYNAVILPGQTLKLGFGASPGNVESGPENYTLTKIAVIPYEPEEDENNSPAFLSVPVIKAVEGEEYIYQAEAEDQDGDILIYSLEEKPEGMEIDPDSGLIRWLPGIGQAGEYSIRIKVIDGRGGMAAQEYTLSVYSGLSAPPVVAFTDELLTIQQGGSVILTWTAEGAQTAHIDNGIGVVEPNGTISVSPDHTRTYTITVTGATGSANAHVTVKVLGNPEPQPEGTFGQGYNDLIPEDATVDKYSEDRFSLVTGLICSARGVPLEGVVVTIFDHPEYGTVYTDQDGKYTIPVEGGGTLTVVYHKEQYLTAQRQIQVPWNHTAIADTVQMLMEDSLSTSVAFDGDPQTVTTHNSTLVADEWGSRSITMVFNGDNKAWMVDEEGNDIHPLETITVRATEFTTQDSMPAVLPPNTAYTYCAELAVDGVERVRFEKPVVTWVDNFLDFPVGEIVPSGYFDRDRNLWIPSENGVVVMLLDLDGDGVVDALDNTGDGEADITDPEQLQGLEDSNRYQPEATFWRVEVTHFTPWDYNWPYGPPMDAISPNAEGAPQMQQDRTFYEEIAVPGTDFSLHYASDRVKGYKTVITVPVSGESVPASLDSIIVELRIAGRTFQKTLPAAPNQVAEFEWDGLDHLGREIGWATPAEVRTGFVYPAVYHASATDRYWAFARFGTAPTLVDARQPFYKWSSVYLNTYTSGRADTIGEGWTLSPHHQKRLKAVPILLRGDGSTAPFADINFSESIAYFERPPEFAPNGSAMRYDSGFSKKAGSPENSLKGPLSAVATDSDGSVYAATYEGNIYKVGTDGSISVVVERQWNDDTGNNGGDNSLYGLQGIVLDLYGSIYVSTYESQIKKVDTNGKITIVAGNGEYGYSGDGGPAVNASLANPVGIAWDSSGNLYIADEENNRIRKVDPNGVITTVAGNGEFGYSGDGGMSVNAALSYPRDVSVDLSGNLYVADAGNNRIRKVDLNGVITTVAGNGGEGYGGDGGPAVEAALGHPESIGFDGAGNLYIADTWNNAIRKVFSDGIIMTIAGTDQYSYDEDPTHIIPALSKTIYRPQSISFDGAGDLLVAERSYVTKIFKVPFPVASLEEEEYTFAEGNLYYTFDAAGRHQRTVDLATGVTIYEFMYNQNDQLAGIKDRFNRLLTIERDSNGRVQAMISPDGIRTALLVEGGRLTEIVYPDGTKYGLSYAEGGLLTGISDLNGNLCQGKYDSTGRLTSISDGEGGEWKYDRVILPGGRAFTAASSAEGNITLFEENIEASGAAGLTVKEPSGAETVRRQEAGNLNIKEQLPDGSALRYHYDLDPQYYYKYARSVTMNTPLADIEVQTKKDYEDTDGDGKADLITVITSVGGKETVTTQDLLTSALAVTSPEGRTVTAKYNPETLLIEREDIPGQLSTYYEYDGNGRLRYERTGDRQTEYRYNQQGLLSEIITPLGKNVSCEYDAVGRMTALHNPDGSSIYYEYDNNGNVTVFTTPSDAHHEYRYNKVDAATKYVTPQSGDYSYTYNKDRQLTAMHSPGARQTHYRYNRGQLAEIVLPGGDLVNLEYLGGVFLSKVTRNSESVSYDYTGPQVTRKTLSGMVDQVMEYGYNDDLMLSSFSYAGKNQAYTYDRDGLLTKAGNYSIARDAQNGRPVTISGDLLNISTSYTNYGEIEGRNYKTSGQITFSWSAIRDKVGRITQKTEDIGGADKIYRYTYDDFGRLLTVSLNGTRIEEYGYDEAGRRISSTSLSRNLDGRTHTYSAEDHLLAAGDVRYEYDVDGFLVKRIEGARITEYSYSGQGELTEVALADGKEIEYLYDVQGKRIAKKVNGSITEKYLWEGLNLLAVYDGSDNLLMRFEYAEMMQPVSVEKGGSLFYLAWDQAGSLRAVSDTAGSIVKAIEYDSFGNILSDTNPAWSVPFGFAGGLHDHDTGLIRFGARDYDPDTGRWTAKDPTFFGGGDTDLYGYCFNDPINYADQSGDIPVETVVDVISVGTSLYALVRNPNMTNAVYLAWDVVAAFVPYAPGSYVVKGAKFASLVDNSVGVTRNAGKSIGMGDFKYAEGTGNSVGAARRLTYEASPKHGATAKGSISAAPRNGQEALDLSIQVKPTSPRRISIDYKTGEFNVFDQTSSGVFHGHVRTWNQLTSEMQRALRQAGMVDSKGRILGGQ